MNGAASRSRTTQIFLYFTPLTLLVYLVLPHSYLVDIASAYMLKNRLHATAAQISAFRIFTALPVYFSFAFGLTRDLWNPFGLRDRGFFLIFGLATGAIFLALAIAPLSYAGLFVGVFAVMISFRFVAAAYQGLMALVSQEQLLSGRLSAVWQLGSSVASLVAALTAGYVVEHLAPYGTFVLIALFALGIAALAAWKPAAVFSHTYDRPQARGTNFFGDLRRLAKHRAIYAPVLIVFMFQFAPGFNTPMQFYLSNTLHSPDWVYAYFNGIFAAAFIPPFFAYGYLCKKFRLKTLLWWGSVITVPQMIPLAFIHTGVQALWLAVPMGLMGGIAVGAFFDLTMRSCPPGLQGSLMMLVDGASLLSTRGSDVLGSVIYDSDPRNGFYYCVIATTLVYAAILPLLFLIPREIMATAEGEPNPALEAKMLAEIAEAEFAACKQ